MSARKEKIMVQIWTDLHNVHKFMLMHRVYEAININNMNQDSQLQKPPYYTYGIKHT